MRRYSTFLMMSALSIVLIAMMALSATARIDVSAKTPDSFRKIFAGDDAMVSISLRNPDAEGRKDVILSYSLVYDGAVIDQRSETVALETQANMVRTFSTQVNATPGDYTILVDVTSGEETARASSSFTIGQGQDDSLYKMAAAVFLILLLIYLIIASRPALKRYLLRRRVRRIVRKRAEKR